MTETVAMRVEMAIDKCTFDDIARGVVILANSWIRDNPGVEMSPAIARAEDTLSVEVSARPSIAELEAMLADG